MPNLSADIFCDATGSRWTAEIRRHPLAGGDGVLVWSKANMRSQWHAETAMEAAWRRQQSHPLQLPVR